MHFTFTMKQLQKEKDRVVFDLFQYLYVENYGEAFIHIWMYGLRGKQIKAIKLCNFVGNY